MELDVKFQGGNTIGQIKKLKDELNPRLKKGMTIAVQVLRGRIDKAIASGEYGIKTNTGDLRRSLATAVVDEKGGVIGIVGSALIYSRIQEMGGVTRPKPTVTPRLRAWAWAMYYETGIEMYKAMALTKKMYLEPTVKIPAHWYMRNSFIAVKEQILSVLNKSIGEAK